MHIKTKKTELDTTVDALLTRMSVIDFDSEEYATLTERLSVLYKLKEVDSKSRVSPDTLAIVAGNLLGIALIVGHERVGVVTSKALGFVLKAR